MQIIQNGDPILRTPARSLSTEEILSQEIQELIEKMKITMQQAPGVGLAAPQIGKAIQIVVIEDLDHSHLTSEQVVERERVKVPFHVLINPQIRLEEETVEFFEGCLSLPHLVGLVPRARKVTVEYLDERAEPHVVEATGWYARILQHEIDHLQATLFVDRAHEETVMNDGDYEAHWKDKRIAEVKRVLLRG